MREWLGKLAEADYKKYWCSAYVREAQGSSKVGEILATLLFHFYFDALALRSPRTGA